MGVLIASSLTFCLCVVATPARPERASTLVLCVGLSSVILFVSRCLGFVLEACGW